MQIIHLVHNALHAVLKHLPSALRSSHRVLFASLGFLAATSGHAADPELLSIIGKQIEQHQVVRADFSQAKQMAALKRPLLTHGKLVYSSRHGVLWQIERPYRVSYLLGETKIIEISADGSRKERGVRDIPGLAQVGRVFRAMLGADTNALQAHFDATVTGSAQQWNIVLQPKQAQVQQFLKQLQLSGGQFVEQIDIAETSGDLTNITFSNSIAAAAPSASEQQLLDSLQAK
ncbi:outer membrane lipoprotein carrier protein LolA [Methylobacillus caricis]|uniref:LolA family protein n=1 Tax=Methylobacillus caricis TaxID=1971611 RepID=UPI001CFFF496|nr:outer membrane lipoprotein carrier protein LolA [Methylobacillus caricis]MCB5188042.1 outer membrane lipoprotein carrier protein LolA [Methylobacillus caricis]